MKKLLFIFVCILIVCTPCLARSPLLSGVAATGASKGVTLSDFSSTHTVEVYYTDANASITVLTVDLEGSIDPSRTADASAHWFQLASYTLTSAELTAKQAMFHVVNKGASRLRVNITTLTGADAGDAVTVLLATDSESPGQVDGGN